MGDFTHPTGCHRPRRRATQYSRDGCDSTIGRGALDRPVKPGDDSGVWRRPLLCDVVCDCPTGKSLKTCPPLAQKIFRFALTPNQPYNSRHPAPTRGAYRDRHGRRVRGAVAAAVPGAQQVLQGELAHERRPRAANGAEADGKAVWSWRPWLASSRRRCCEPNRVCQHLQSAGDGGKRNSSPGRARYKP
jgi:hypothetical protein